MKRRHPPLNSGPSGLDIIYLPRDGKGLLSLGFPLYGRHTLPTHPQVRVPGTPYFKDVVPRQLVGETNRRGNRLNVYYERS